MAVLTIETVPIEDDGQRAIYQGKLFDGRYVELHVFTIAWTRGDV